MPLRSLRQQHRHSSEEAEIFKLVVERLLLREVKNRSRFEQARVYLVPPLVVYDAFLGWIFLEFGL